MISSSVVAEIAGCTDRMVRICWNNPNKEKKTTLHKKVDRITEHLSTGTNKLIEKVKKSVPL